MILLGHRTVKELSNVKITLNGIVLALVDLMHQWNPGQFGSEREYRDSLLDFLVKSAPDCHIQKEYRHAGTTADIYFEKGSFFLSGKVFFELKRNLVAKGECDRLVGQIRHFIRAKCNVLIVLCGETNRALAKHLQSEFSEFINDNHTVLLGFWSREPSMAIVLKSS